MIKKIALEHYEIPQFILKMSTSMLTFPRRNEKTNAHVITSGVARHDFKRRQHSPPFHKNGGPVTVRGFYPWICLNSALL